MKLDRNINPDGRGKYALVKIRELTKLEANKDFSATSAVEALHERGIVDYGDTPEASFFVIRLKDRFAAKAIAAYANAVLDAALDERDSSLLEYHNEIAKLVWLSSVSEQQRTPD